MNRLIVLLLVGWHGADGRSSTTAPTWPAKYMAKGTLSMPYAEIEEPFVGYYDSSASCSRIDYYGGTVKTFQMGNYSSYGSTIEIIPITTESEANVETCVAMDGDSDDVVTVQSVLPDLTDFVLTGTEEVNGYSCEKWTYNETIEEKVSKYAMYIRYTKKKGVETAIPVRYEMRGYDSLWGSHYDHYYITYSSYKPSTVPTGTFDLTGMTCGDFPDSSVTLHRTTLNPMREFIHRDVSHIHQAFDEFKSTHGKSYETKSEEKKRREIFHQNYRYIQSMNRKGLGFTLAPNHLSDKDEDELRILRGRKSSKGVKRGQTFPYSQETLEKTTVPTQYDWRLYGAVTPVKDQAVCGSCWSFGSSGVLEGAYFVKTGTLLSFSSQALVDCSWGYGNDGCDGGLDYQSYEWVMKHGGIPLDDEYGGYLGQDGYCHVNSTTLYANITGYVDVTPKSEKALKVALLKNGPISIAIDASLKTFSFYSNGVFYDADCKSDEDDLDHSVLLVGYGTLKGTKYWLVKNSWSNYWGDDGYVLMAIKNNNCGVMTSPTYPTM